MQMSHKGPMDRPDRCKHQPPPTTITVPGLPTTDSTFAVWQVTGEMRDWDSGWRERAPAAIGPAQYMCLLISILEKKS